MDPMDRDHRPPQEQEKTRLASLFLRSTFIAASARILGNVADSWVCFYPLRSKSICGAASVRTLWHCALYERDYIVHAWTRRCNPGHDLVACYHRSGGRNWVWLSGTGDWISAGALSVFLAARSYDLAARRPRWHAAHRV